MGRLVVVSNRVPPPADRRADAGGLAVALKSALSERGGLWLGWSGQTVVTADGDQPPVHTRQEGNIEFHLVDLTERDLDEYYRGLANSSLWPLLHYRLDLVDFDRQDMTGYLRVNAFFARALAPLLRPDDVVWVHDYHLIPLAAALRAAGCRNRIGFFLHIPWPPPDIWYAMPVHRQLLEAFSSYDLVGFQTDYDVENFAGCLRREGIAEAVGDSVYRAGKRTFAIGAFPVGIATAEFAEIARSALANPMVRRTIESLEDRRLIIGVDRLDYSKGIENRMIAYERFLANNRDWHDRVVYLQVTPKSRSEVPEYARMQREVAQMAGRINGAFGQLDWTPIRYVNRTINRTTLAGLYRTSRVGLVTPLRDGMNLVAKEFVAAQNGEDPGVLILSRFAGAARELDRAILVNPYDLENTAGAIAQALSMPRAERIERWRPMFAAISANDAGHWARGFLAALDPVRQERTVTAAAL